MHTLLVVACALLVTSCSGDSVKVEGQLSNLEGSVLRVIAITDSTVVGQKVDVNPKGKFSTSIDGVSQPTIVTVLNHRNELLANAVAEKGGHIKLQGDASKPQAIKVTGSDLNERWQLFRDEHAAFYSDPNPSRLDAAIQKYVRENPTDILSTVLLMADYSNLTDRSAMDAMLSSLNPKARPASLVRAYKAMEPALTSRPVSRMMNLMLWRNGSFDELTLVGRITLLYLWTTGSDNRAAVVDAIKQASRQAGTSLQVADVLVESDTIRWHRTVAGDSASWHHYWSPGGPQDASLSQLNITTTPWFVVVDATGSIAYNGNDVQQACRIAQEKAQVR